MEIKHKKTGEVYQLHLQQYKVGLYVCTYKEGKLDSQFGANIGKNSFIKNLRKTFYIGAEIDDN